MVPFRWISQILVRWQRLSRIQKAKQWHYRTEARPFALALEPRRVLNAAPVVPQAASAASQPAQVVVNAGKAANDGKADTFVISKSAAGDVVTINGKVQQVVAPGEKIVIQGSSDNDIVQIDFSNGNPLGANEISFAGNGGTDSIQLIGSAVNVVHHFGANGTGSVAVDGGTLSYSPNVTVSDSLSVNQRTFELDDGGNLEIGDSTTSGIGEARGQHGQDVQFTESSATLSINTTQTGSVANQITINNLDSSVRRNLTINADSSDSVMFVGLVDLNSGDLTATAGTIYVSGQIQTNSADVQLLATSQLTIDSTAKIVDAGGQITADAGLAGTLIVSGQIDASNLQLGQTGGAIHLLGNQVGLSGATIDARGDAGGGEILVGGDFHGTNASIHNASQTIVDKNTTLNASAVRTGSGGNVVVWSNQGTVFSGKIIATGGSTGGDGGKAEVSGGQLGFDGTANLSSAYGTAGSLLLDPKNIIVQNAGSIAYSDNVNNKFSNISNLTLIVSATSIVAILNGGTAVTLQANNDLTVNDNIIASAGGAGGDLILQAGRSILIKANITTDNGNLTATANETAANGVVDANRDAGNAVITIDAGKTIDAGSGTVTLHVSTGAGLTNHDSGNLTLGNIKAGSLIATNDNGQILDTSTAIAITNNASLTGTSITVGGATATTTFGTVTFNSAGAVSIQVDGNTELNGVNTADSLSLSSTGTITDSSTSLDVTNNAKFSGTAITVGGAATTNIGSLTFNSAGDVSIQADSAMAVTGANTANNVLLDVTGDITQPSGTITAQVMRLISTGSIGTNAQRIQADVKTVAASANGNIVITVNDTNNDGVNIGAGDANADGLAGLTTTSATGIIDFIEDSSAPGGGITVAEAVTAAGGGVSLRAHSPLVVNANVTDSGGGNILLAAEGNTAADDLTINANVTASGGNGNIQLFAGDTISETSARVISTAGTGAITARAGTDYNGGAIQDGTNSGVLTMAATATMQSQDGNITLRAPGDITVGVINANSNNDATLGNVLISADDSGASGTQSNGSGAIIDGNAATLNVTAGGLALSAASGIATNTNPLEMQVQTVAGKNTTTNGIYLEQLAAGGDLTIGTTGGLTGLNTSTANTNIDVKVDNGQLNVNGAVQAGNGIVRLQSTGDITQTAAITGQALGAISTAGNIVLSLATNNVASLAAQATSGGKKVNYRDADDFKVDTVAADTFFAAAIVGVNVGKTAGSTVRLRSGGDITQDAASPVIADALGAEATGDVDLCLAQNDINTFAAKAGGAIDLRYVSAFSLTTPVTADGTLSADLTNVSSTDLEYITDGNLVVDTAINITGKLTLISVNGSVTQTANITAGSLAVQAKTFVDLSTQMNNVDNFAASADQYVYYRDADSVTITTVTGDPDCNITDTVGVQTVSGNIEIHAATNIVVNQVINAPTHAVRLWAEGGTITQNAAGKITSTDLSAIANGLIDLCDSPNNDVTTFAATSTTGSIYFFDVNSFTVGSVAAGVAVNQQVIGVTATAANASVELHATTTLNINQVVTTSLATGTVRLQAATSISQIAAGVITTGSLSAQSNGLINLCDAVNDATIFAATGASVYFDDANSVTVGTVLGGTCVVANQVGVTSTANNGSVEIHAVGAIELDNAVAASMTTGTVRLQAATSVTQLAAGVVTANSLSVQSDGLIDLCESANNDVNFFAATSTNNSIYFFDKNSFTVSTVNGGTCVTGTVTGVTATAANQNIELHATNDLHINQVVTASQTTGTVRLEGLTSIDQTSAGVIKSNLLSAISNTVNGMIDLCVAANDVNTFAAIADTVSFFDANSFQIGNVAAGTCITTAVNGITAATAIDLKANNDFDVNAALTSATVRLQSVNGSLTQSAKITATSLLARAAVNINFCTVDNDVTTFAASATTGFVYFDELNSITIGSVAGSTCVAAFSGITAGTNVEVHAGGDIGITQTVNAQNNTIRLHSGGGITQTATGNVVATNLSAAAANTIDLCDSTTNNVSTFAATSTNGSVYYLDADNLTIGQVAEGTCVTSAQTGVTATAANQNVELHALGSLSINHAVSVNTTTGTIRLQGNTSIQQNANGNLTANALSAFSNGLINLCDATANDVSLFAATSTNGSIYYHDANSFTVDSVAGGTCITTAQFGVTATGTNQSIELRAPVDLIINQAVTGSQANGTGGTIRLEGDNSISQTATGTIVGDKLSAFSDGKIDLCETANNDVNTFAATSTNDSIYYHDLNSLTIGSVTAGTCVTTAQTGVTATADNQNVELRAGGNLVLNQAVSASQTSGTIRLEGDTSISQATTGTVKSNLLSAFSNGTIDLCDSASNDVNTFAATSTNGSVYFHDVNSLIIGSVTGGTCITTAQIGVTAMAVGQNIELRAGGVLTINQAVTASQANGTGGTIRLEGDTSIGQAATGTIKGDKLSAFSNGLIDLCDSASNDVNTFAATSTNSSVLYHDINSLTIDTVTGGTCITTAQTGVTATTAGESIELRAGGVLTINQAVTASQTSGTVRLEGDTSIGQAAAGTIKGDKLSAFSNGTIDLCDSASNDVNTFAATSINGSVLYHDANSLTIDSVIGGTGITTAQTGVTATTDGQNIEIRAGGTLTLNQAVTASLTLNTGGTIRLEGDTAITQSATGVMTGDKLSAFSNGTIDLCDAITNDVNTFAATSTTGSVLYHDLNSFTVGTVTGGTCITVAQIGATATANGQSVELRAPGTLTIDQAVQVSQTGGTIRLEGDTSIVQTATGAVSGDMLSAWSNGVITLNVSANNNVRQFAAIANVNGNVLLNNNGVLAITKILGGTCVANDVDGVTGANIVINTAGANANLSVYHAVNTNTGGTISLKAQANVLVASTIGGTTVPTVTIEATTGQILRGYVVDPTGSNNALIFTDIRPNSGRSGDLEIQYVTSANAGTSATATAPDASGKVVVTITLKAGGSTAAEIINAIAASSTANTVVSAAAAPGNSTSGLVVESMDVVRSGSVVIGQTVSLKGQAGIGTGTISIPELEGVTDGHPKGTVGNDINWANAIGANTTGVYVKTQTLNLTGVSSGTVQGDVWVDVNPWNAGFTTSINPVTATGNVVVTSGQGNNSGSISVNSITSNNHILVYTNASVPGGATNSVNINVGHLQSSLLRTNTTNLNSIAVDSDGSLTQLTNYEIVTGNMILLQLLQDAVHGPFVATTPAELAQIYANYNFFQIQSPFPSPTQTLIKALQNNAVIATFGVQGTIIGNPAAANSNVLFTDIRAAADRTHPITITYVDPGVANSPASINVLTAPNGAITIQINLATGPGGAITTTANDIVNLINGNATTNVLVTAFLTNANNGTGVVAATSGVVNATEKGWNIAIDWGDGSVTLIDGSAPNFSYYPLPAGNPTYQNPDTDFTQGTPNNLNNPGRPNGSLPQDAATPLTLKHYYSSSTTAVYHINLTVSVDPSISLATHTTTNGITKTTYFEQQTILTVVQSSVVPPPFSIFFPKPEVVVPPVIPVATVQINAVQPIVNPPPPIVIQDAEGAAFEKRRYLALFLIPEDGSDPIAVSLIQDGKPTKELDLKILIGNQLIEQFKNLPDGRYRLELYRTLNDEVLDERTILETVITNGTPSNPLDELIEQLRRTFEREVDSEKDEAKQDGAALEVIPSTIVPVTTNERDDDSTGMAAAGAWGGLFGFFASRSQRTGKKSVNPHRRSTQPSSPPEV